LYNDKNLEDDAVYSNNDAIDSNDCLSNATLVLEEGVSEVTIVPGTQLTPYSNITAASHGEAVG
jgi:hypothetical protein